MCYDSTTENCVRQSPACSPCPFWACYNLDNTQPCFHCCGNGCRKERCRKKKALGTSGKWRHHDLLNRELELEAMPKDMEIDYLKYLLFSIFKRMHVQGLKKKSNCKKKKNTKQGVEVLFSNILPQLQNPTAKEPLLAIVHPSRSILCRVQRCHRYPHAFLSNKLYNFIFSLIALSIFTYQ